MYLTYFDESGDTGLVNSPTTWFVLNAVLVHEQVWLDTLDALRGFRRELRTKYGIPVQNEIKALDFRYGRGPFKGLHISRKQRFDIYRQFMEFEATLNVRTFSVAIGKAGAFANGWEPRTTAWQFAMERIQRFCESRDDYATIFPDEGHGFFIRALMRQMRRFHYIPARFGGSARSMKIERVLEDPNDRQSQESYFVQLADLNAYATHRHTAIDPGKHVPSNLWDKLSGPKGDVRLWEVNGLSGGPLGIKRFP
jgi:hypothetical protein